MAANISATYLHCSTLITLILLEINRKKDSPSKRSLTAVDVMLVFTYCHKPSERDSVALELLKGIVFPKTPLRVYVIGALSCQMVNSCIPFSFGVYLVLVLTETWDYIIDVEERRQLRVAAVLLTPWNHSFLWITASKFPLTGRNSDPRNGLERLFLVLFSWLYIAR